MTPKKPTIRCAIYTRKSHEEGLDQDFNSLDAQRAAAEAFVESQKQEGWQPLRKRYDDGGFTGGNMDRPALKELLADIEAGHVDAVVVYKVDRLSRSLLDFARLIDLFDQHKVAFVSVTQQFNTSTPMGRLVLNILLSFAQFERELAGERIRDKKLATARQGKYVGGQPPFGYDVVNKKYVVNQAEAPIVLRIFETFVEAQSFHKVAKRLNAEGLKTKSYGPGHGGSAWTRRRVLDVLRRRIHIGQIEHKGKAYPGEHEAIVPVKLFDRVQAILYATGEERDWGKPYLKHWTLLRGLIRCGHCGALMRSSATKNKGRHYRYYICGTKISKSYKACCLPAVPCGEIDRAVVDQMRAILRQPEMVARTYRAVCEQANARPDEATMKRVQELRDRQRQTQAAIRAVLASGQEGEFIASELARLNGELKTLGEAIGQAEAQMAKGPVDLGRVGAALRNIDPLWDSLFPAEQERIVRLLIEKITITTGGLDIRFRANGIEQIVDELKPVEVLKRA